VSDPRPGGSSTGAFQSQPPNLTHQSLRAERAPRWWLHAVLFAATLASSTFCGGLYYGWLPSPDLGDRLLSPQLLAEGLKFSLPLMIILLAHELGHYLAARRHRLRPTPPYFIPMPLPLPFSPGTLGAVIRIKAPVRSRRQLMDVGAAGPIAGFVALLPFLLVGSALSGVQDVDPDQPAIYFGEPLIFRFVARVLFAPELQAGQDIMLHPTAWAAWFGLFVTALNMLPFFQLDGGHVAYALFGRAHRAAAWPLLLTLIALGFLWPGWWVWSIVLAILGPQHPPVVDEARPLDPGRRWIGWLAILIFVVSFSPVPIWISG
jgi:membrane-associated protease RseP (regulator of RpoE activity)